MNFSKNKFIAFILFGLEKARLVIRRGFKILTTLNKQGVGINGGSI